MEIQILMKFNRPYWHHFNTCFLFNSNQHSAAPLKIKRLARDPDRFLWALSVVQSRSVNMQLRIGALVQNVNMLVPYAGNFLFILHGKIISKIHILLMYEAYASRQNLGMVFEILCVHTTNYLSSPDQRSCLPQSHTSYFRNFQSQKMEGWH